jgi:hypothetical protein
MRDTSASYWFHPGDAVRVCAPVSKASVNLKGRVGVVVETWEKCDVDPTCCCAEQVERGMAVRVEFPGGLACDDNDTSPSESSSSFTHYFAEDELVKVTPGASTDELGSPSELMDDLSPSMAGDPVPFDGVGCVAFKLDKLQIDSKSRKIASFEPVSPPPV